VWRVGLLVVVGCASGPPSHPWLAYAIGQSADENKPLIVELGASWCKPCRVFETRVLPDPRVQAALADVIFVRYDVDTPVGHDAMLRCRARGVPTVVAIDHAGWVRMMKTGTEPTADEFLVFLRQAHTLLGPK